jgi:mannonate dehydratase
VERRSFIKVAGAGTAASASITGVNAVPKKALMKAGTQHSTADDVLSVMAAFGVNHVCGALPSRKLDENWSLEGLSRYRERVEKFGLHLDMLPLPLSSAYITKAEYPSIMLGQSPDRDKAIDEICQMIRNASKAGIPSLKYNLTILGVVRTESAKGRGGATLSTFEYDKARQEPPLTEAGLVPAEMSWERITYFLKRVIPVAEEYKVKMACHPHDPGMPPVRGYRGVDRVLGSVAGMKRFIQISPSPYHGLNFCQGTVTEMLENPAKEIFDVIRYFGSRKKIFNVHFRNIRGKFLNFVETLPDDGDVDMIKCMRVYSDIGYDGMMMPDHVPTIQGDQGGRQAFAFSLGYIQALIQLVSREG